jgi:hypothetical protein
VILFLGRLILILVAIINPSVPRVGTVLFG